MAEQVQTDRSSADVAVVLAELVRTGVEPGAVFATGTVSASGKGEQVDEVVVVGHAQNRGGPVRDMRRDTLFDLASLTKVMATLPAVLRLAERGDLAVHDPAWRYLPELRDGARDGVTIRNLLSHSAGLPAELPLWQSYTDPEEATRALLAVPLSQPPDTAVVYSDPGFMLLGKIIEAVTGAPLDVAVADLVTGPLGLRQAFFCPSEADRDRCAATEPQRDGTALVGVVHDENARMLRGVAGHAGLFATVDDVGRYLARGWLDPASDFLSEASRAQACTVQTSGLDGRRGLGWVLRGDSHDQLGPRWPASAATHTGFTGTSLAFDRRSGAWAVLLTNDVHYGRGRGVIGMVRKSVFDACVPGLSR
jgi:serine-type D-Ala-D-Ala carboxypeptidase